ncbi:tetratricopeptide repeat protein [Flavobacterium foetidum]|uniref:tetratricopeptide repeat protein n=1 Tax=Flavobacterium foetidum TaxID=2026681 RepID=UPI0010752EF1|nr:tetratricopeptide repeat protein [Flavobacterium foetidum]KAF2507401.1 tetratricopeptide repeat protein [Flavobacterium foetidum]
MKNYRSYERVEPIYFSGEIFFPVGLFLAAATVTYLLLYFLGLGVAIFFNVAIGWLGYSYVYYYGKLNSKITIEFLIGVFLIILLLLFVDYGAYALVYYQETGVFNRLYFAIWISILLGVPAFYYIRLYSLHYYKKKSLADIYFKSSFGVYHDRELLMYIDSIAFVNTAQKLISNLKIENDNCFYSDEELAEMNAYSRNYDLKKSAFSSLVYIPFNADRFEMAWYSVIEDQYYQINVDFPFHKIVLEQEKYPLDESDRIKGKKAKRFYLQLYQNGGFKLYNEDVVFLEFEQTQPSTIHESVKQKKLADHRRRHKYYSDPEHFSKFINCIRTSNSIQKRREVQEKLLLWNLKFSGLNLGNYIEASTASFKDYKLEKEDAAQYALRYLPNQIVFVYRGSYLFPWLTIHINTLKLDECIEAVRDEAAEEVSFLLHFSNSDGENLEFIVKGNEKQVFFKDWEIVIDERHKKDMDEEQYERQEDEKKRELLKTAWNFVFAKNYEEAQKNCDALIAMDPKYGFAYFLEARLLWYTKGFEVCYSQRDYFFAKTAHEPAALAHIYNSFGCILDLEKRYEEALAYFKNAIEINPKEPIYRCNLGEMYYKLENPSKALREAKKAQKLGYESDMLTEILENRGRINLKTA